jgi:endo-1,3-1,4-beta-glycanase ExoK
MTRAIARLSPVSSLIVSAATSATLTLALVSCNKAPPDPEDKGPAVARGGSSGNSSSGGSSGSSSTGGSPATGGSGNASGGAPGGGGSGGAPSSGGGSGSSNTGGSGGGAGGGSDAAPGAGGAPPAADSGGAPADPLPAGVQGHPNAATSYPKYPGFTLALVEEFDGALDLDQDPVWTWSDGGLTEGKVRFVKEAITFKDGKMLITARTPGVKGSNSFAEPVTDGDSGFVANKEVASGEMRTKFNNYRYGMYEARFRPPQSNGNFVSTLFAFRTPKFEDWREIDIELTADRPLKPFTNLIYANNVGAWNPSIAQSGENFPEGPGTKPVPAGFNHQTDFHTYAFEWLPEKVTWFVDGTPIRVKAQGGLPVPEKSAKIVMNLWIFAIAGGFGGDPTRNAYPLTAEYDWFRFYKWDNDKNYPCMGPPNCLPAEDRNKSKNNPADGLTP